MKAVNNLQELWSYCLFCPVCQDMTRDIQILVGPDQAFELLNYEKINDNLYLNCFFYTKVEEFRIKYNIDCLNNSFSVDISDATPSQRTVNGAAAAYFYFYINSDCRKCDSSYSNSSDLELDMLKKYITNIGIEREGVYLLTEPSKFHITFEHDNNKMLISKCFVTEHSIEVLDENKAFKFPIINFDFSNPKKVVNKIKTLFVFS